MSSNAALKKVVQEVIDSKLDAHFETLKALIEKLDTATEDRCSEVIHKNDTNMEAILASVAEMKAAFHQANVTLNDISQTAAKPKRAPAKPKTKSDAKPKPGAKPKPPAKAGGKASGEASGKAEIKDDETDTPAKSAVPFSANRMIWFRKMYLMDDAFRKRMNTLIDDQTSDDKFTERMAADTKINKKKGGEYYKAVAGQFWTALKKDKALASVMTAVDAEYDVAKEQHARDNKPEQQDTEDHTDDE